MNITPDWREKWETAKAVARENAAKMERTGPRGQPKYGKPLQVYDAVKSGARTCREVRAMTGIENAASFLSKLLAQGKLYAEGPDGHRVYGVLE